jgi:type I restriction enzyme S subunit
LKIEATINQHVTFINPRNKKKITPEYLQAFLTAAYTELRRMSNDSGSTKGALTCEDLRHFRVLLPPLDEQERIVHWLLEATAEVGATIQNCTREIDLIREYRTRLVVDVVIGQLDVRHLDLPEAGQQLIKDLADSDLGEIDEETDEELEEAAVGV